MIFMKDSHVKLNELFNKLTNLVGKPKYFCKFLFISFEIIQAILDKLSICQVSVSLVTVCTLFHLVSGN